VHLDMRPAIMLELVFFDGNALVLDAICVTVERPGVAIVRRVAFGWRVMDMKEASASDMHAVLAYTNCMPKDGAWGLLQEAFPGVRERHCILIASWELPHLDTNLWLPISLREPDHWLYCIILPRRVHHAMDLRPCCGSLQIAAQLAFRVRGVCSGCRSQSKTS
jgi:hypothetical protein